MLAPIQVISRSLVPSAMDGAQRSSPTSPLHRQFNRSCPHHKDAPRTAETEQGAFVLTRKYSSIAIASLKFLGIFTATHLSVCLFVLSSGTIVTGVLCLTGSNCIPNNHVASGILYSVGVTVLIFGSLIFTLSIAIFAFACKWGKESKLFSPTVTPCPVPNATVTESFELGQERQLIQLQQLQRQQQLTAFGENDSLGQNTIKSQDGPVDGSLVHLTDATLYPSHLQLNHSQELSRNEAIDTVSKGGIGGGSGGGDGGGRPLAVMIHASDQRQQPNNHSLASLHLKTQSATQLAPVSVTQCDSLPLPLDAASVIPNSSMGAAATTVGHPFPPNLSYLHPYHSTTGHFISGHNSITGSLQHQQQPHAILTHPAQFNAPYYHNNNGHNVMPFVEASAPPYHQIQGDS